jgi:hypothetical protein
MANKKYKSTKLFCLRKDNLYVAWNEQKMVEKPQEGVRLSKTMCERKYPEFEMIPFPDAYDQWYRAFKGAKA